MVFPFIQSLQQPFHSGQSVLTLLDSLLLKPWKIMDLPYIEANYKYYWMRSWPRCATTEGNTGYENATASFQVANSSKSSEQVANTSLYLLVSKRVFGFYIDFDYKKKCIPHLEVVSWDDIRNIKLHRKNTLLKRAKLISWLLDSNKVAPKKLVDEETLLSVPTQFNRTRSTFF
jgi:hypothetical protein